MCICFPCSSSFKKYVYTIKFGRSLMKNLEAENEPKNLAIYKTGGMPTKILGNLLEDSGECSHFSVPGNAREDSGNVIKDSRKCSKRFQGMFEKIPGNVIKDSGECSRRFRGMLSKIPGNVQKDSGECFQF